MFGEIFGEQGVIVLILLLVVFGSSQLPKLARSLGEAQKELRRSMRSDDDEPAPPGTDAEARPSADTTP